MEETMEIDYDKLVFLNEIPEMSDAQRKWLREQCGAGKGYFEPETGNFVIMIPA
jgi:hypothetical protein